jgi:integrase
VLRKKIITPKGIRDYAILMLLSKYGVRIGEITNLRLDDLDWPKEVIRIWQSKTGLISYLPWQCAAVAYSYQTGTQTGNPRSRRGGNPLFWLNRNAQRSKANVIIFCWRFSLTLVPAFKRR